MRAWIVIAVVLLAGACAKKKSEDKAPAATEPSVPAAEPVPATDPPTEGGATTGTAPGGVGGSGPAMGSGADTKAQMPADDGGEAKAKVKMPSDDGGEIKKPMPSDDGGEAAKRACTQTADCGANHDCCNGFCFKQGTAKHSIECKLPSGKL